MLCSLLRHYSHSFQGVTHLYQMACGVFLSGCVQGESTAKLLTNTLQGCLCCSRPQWLFVADVFFFNSMHFPLPFLHHCGASCLCSYRHLYWCVEKSGSRSDSVRVLSRNKSPQWFRPFTGSGKTGYFNWQHLQAANFQFSLLIAGSRSVLCRSNCS